MIHKPIDSITAVDIQALIDNEVREQRTIEYKRELPGNSDGGKKEFLADVSSFANGTGGDIIYGVDEEDGIPTEASGLEGFDEDDERLRLESCIRDGIAPRIPGIQLHAVPGFDKGPVFVIRIPRSWTGPHMVTRSGTSRFFTRSSAGKYQMDVHEIRNAFDTASNIPRRIQQWREERIQKIISNNGPVTLSSSTCVVLHVIPFESLADQWRFDPQELHKVRNDFDPLCHGGCNCRFNIDGIINYWIKRDATHCGSYAQLFRYGRIEGACSEFLISDNSAFSDEFFHASIDKSARGYISCLQKLDIQPPIVLLLSLTRVKGLTMSVGPRYRLGDLCPIDRDILMVPEIIIEDYECDITRALKPAFDAVCNACGLARSPFFDEDGNWIKR